jgi:Cof subfamily protein (haloacid dehalogenase superfamily)
MRGLKDYKAIFVTDLDGTLLKKDGTVSKRVVSTLEGMEDRVVRVIATGRSLKSFNGVIPSDFPIDYLIFSCGAGVQNFISKNIEFKQYLSYSEADKISSYLMESKITFTAQREIPNNHYIYYFKGDEVDEDFEKRLDIYKDVSEEIKGRLPDEIYTQFIIIKRDLSSAEKVVENLKQRFNFIDIILSTSPLNDRAIWIEIFPKNVSKQYGLNLLINKMNLSTLPIIGVGNDYNDIDFLNVADKSYMVSNGPEELKQRYRVVSHFEDDGVYEALEDSGLVKWSR